MPRERDDRDDDDDAPRRKRRPRDDDDDDERDERPRKKVKKQSKKKKKGMTPAQLKLMVLGGIGAVLLLAVLITAAVFLIPVLFPTPDKTINGIGWYEAHEDVNYTVQAYFPGTKPSYEKHGINVPDGLAKMAGGNTPSGAELSWNVKLWENKYKKREYSVMLFTFPSAGSEPGLMERTILGQRLQEGAGVTLTEERITFGGRPARRVVVQGPERSTVYVMLATGNVQMCCICVYGSGKFDETDPMVAAFLENVTVK
jgi:hypothetical protein